jgi:uncharacterized protein (DUF1778 family)
MPKPKKVGRPKLAKGEAKAHVVVVRLHTEDYKGITAAAKTKKQTVSEWMRETARAAIQ